MTKHAQTRQFITTLLALLLVMSITALACNMQQTPPPPPTPTPLPVNCREQTNITLATTNPPNNAVGYQTIIEDFLNSGGAPSELEFALKRWGAIDEETGGYVIADQDFNNDGYYDVLVTLHYPAQTATIQQPGQLLLFGCEGPNGRYSNFYSFISAMGSPQRMPQVYTPIQDITNDGLLDLIFQVEECTSIACYREPIIMTWNPRETRMVPLSTPFAELYVYKNDAGEHINGLPFAGIELDSNGKDQPYTFIIQENHITSREAGPHRPARYTWAWHGYRYLHILPPGYAPSSYLIHVLRDADYILSIRNFEEAARRYRTVIHEGQPIEKQDEGQVRTEDNENYLPLNSWGGILAKEENRQLEEERLKAYARYRLVLTHAGLHDGQTAQEILLAMQREIPWQQGNTPTYYTLLASTFLNAFNETSTNMPNEDALAVACREVQNLATTQYSTTFEFLGDEAYFGPTLADYTAEDLCPFYTPPEETEEANQE